MIFFQKNLFFEKFLFLLLQPRFMVYFFYKFSPGIEHLGILRKLKYDILLDVGANRGQFSSVSKLIYPEVRINAYEPLLQEANIYKKVLLRWPDVQLFEIALGSTRNKKVFHVSKKADSSSILPIGKFQKILFPATSEARTTSVSVAPLDSFPDHWKCASKALLKIDVQGYELEVLRGAVKALKHCAYVYVECSEIPLYDGQALRPTVQNFLEQHGFAHRSRHNETYDPKGALIQADHLFSR